MPVKEMKPTYKIFVVDDDDFDNLYKDLSYMTKEKLKDSLGFANPKTNEAYVRKTGVAEIDDITMEHELQELLANTSPDEIDGIRYKKGGALRNIVPIVLGALAAPFTGGASLIPALLGTVSSIGMNQYAQAKHPEQLGKPGQIGSILMQGLGGAASGLGGAGVAGAIKGGMAGASAGTGMLKGAGQGFMKGAGAFAPTASYPAGTPVGVTNMGTFSQLPGGNVAGLQAAPLSTTQQTLGIGQSILGSALGSSLGSQLAQTPKVGTQVGTQAGAGGTITPQAPVTPTPAPAPSPFNLKNLVTPQNILGAGSLLASQAPKQPEFQMPESVEAIRSKLLSAEGLTPIGQQARLELGNILKSKPTELYPTATDEYYNAVLRRTRESYAQAEKQLDAAYNMAGVYGSGEHLAEKTKLKENLARTESALAAETEQRRFELARTAQYQAIQDSLGVDKNVMDDLVGLTGLDVQTAAMVYGAKAQDVQSIRESLGTLGVELLMRGQGIQKQGAVNINLGGTQ